MHIIESYFINNPNSSQVFLYAGIILLLWLFEGIVLSVSWKTKWKHTFTNILFIATALPIQLFMTIFVLATSVWAVKRHHGLLFLFHHSNSVFVKYVIAFILLDLCEYIYHVIMHKVKLLWSFHLVHHSDPELDVSTTVREHPVETFIRTAFLIVWVYLLGASFGVLLLRQTAQTISNITSHTQFRLPKTLNTIIGWVFITPNLHHVHHHYELPYTDCNYGDVLSIWDRIFNTHFNGLSSNELKFGVNTHMDKKETSRFLGILGMPFNKSVKR